MAPTAPPKPSARALRHQRVTGQIHPLLPPKLFRPDAQTSDSFLTSKQDKRLMKHSSFLSRVQDSSDKISKSKSAAAVKNSKRRQAKKIASLDSLVDALPDVEEGVQLGKVRHKSLRSGRGALKKKERVVKGEMQRFGVSMARLTEAPTAKPAGVSAPVAKDMDEGSETKKDQTGQGNEQTANRWAALRGYISATMEQNPAFAQK